MESQAKQRQDWWGRGREGDRERGREREEGLESTR
jgi:hypothetical protein